MADTDPQKAVECVGSGCWHIDHESSVNICQLCWSQISQDSFDMKQWIQVTIESIDDFTGTDCDDDIWTLMNCMVGFPCVGRPSTSTTAKRWIKPSRTSRMPTTASSKTKMTIWTTRTLARHPPGKSWKLDVLNKMKPTNPNAHKYDEEPQKWKVWSFECGV